jgi:uncharacterized phage protein (TIGR02218 family)
MIEFPFDVTSHAVRAARLVEIVRRDGTIKRIAEAQQTIPGDSNGDWEAVTCEISAIKNALGGDTASLEVRAVHSVGGFFDTEDIDSGRYDGAEVTVYACDRTDPTETVFMFGGTIQPIAYDITGAVTFDVRGPSIGARTGYIQKYAPMCRVDLFSTLCGLNQASFVVSATVVSITDRHRFIVSIGSPPASGYFNGGVVLGANGGRFVCADWQQSTQQVSAFLPCHRLIEVGEVLSMWPGCDKKIATCLSKFSNTANFQGEPHSLGIYQVIAGG